MNKINIISKLLSDESVIIFADGTEIRGAKNVSSFLLKCGDAAIGGFLRGQKQAIIKGVIIGAGIGIASLVINNIVRNRKLIKKIILKEKEA